jgi:tetratricopeptide (TPR) repeat protein
MERKSQAGLILMLTAATLSLGVAGCAKLKARDDLNKGVQAYKNAQFDKAIEYFKESKELDPTLMNARLYLATAYASQYIPGAPSAENKRNGEQAIAEYKEILQIDPNNLNAIDGIGSMLYNMGSNPFDPKMMEESKSYHQMHMKIRPQDPDPYYWIGVIDWSIAYRANKQLRADYNEKARKPIKDLDPLPPAVRDKFVQEDGPIVDEAIDNLKHAIELKPDYANAMAYLNLMLRQKADMETTPEARDADEKLADSLVDKVKEINQKQMNATSSSGSQ